MNYAFLPLDTSVVCNLLSASGSVDLAIFDNSTLWMTVSNDAASSTATQIVRCGGFLGLKPVVKSLVSCRSA